ncbi:sulfatase-like hydrolase/transferase [Sphingobacterium sp. SRCM116780]|uniref:LTA synthase family protein n=1 Tax=Sphingobacterium sp. SRCM116780 TaxID=2907623 RepID=UPI001F2A9BC9|nr:alkaline phosphatase family protein [Sphingobacterium sp. SRCM116780]UIR54694.1 sulfatase-like hydrolase/transferase [Sphingobacterium sp. SRCM116780]
MNRIANELKALTQYFLFWLIICFIDRLLFIASFFEKIGFKNFAEVFKIYYHGLSLDFSAVSYLCVIPFLLYCILSFLPNVHYKRKVLDIYTIVLLVVYFVVSFININIYREWGDKISKRAIDAFFASPSGAVASAESTPIFFPIFGMIVGIVVGYFLYRWMFKKVHFYNIKSPWQNGIKFVIGALLLFTFIRGGYGRATLNPSKAYYSEQSFYNHAAVNTQWALLRDYFSKSTRLKSPYTFYADEAQLQAVLKPAFEANPDSSISILTEKRPNIVVVMLESFVGDLIQSMGGEKGITPNFEKLIGQGVFFDHIYAAADRSDKGMIGIFSAFPAQGPESIIKYIDKHENLPAIGQELSTAGYHGSFYHGGQSEFYNFKSYMLTHGVPKVVDNASFGVDADRASWGVYDHVVLNRMLHDFDTEQKPFFSTIFTLINHEPFNLKDGYKFGDKTNADKFRSTAYYTDSVVYDFINQAKAKSWYKNTLFVVVADHGHRLPAEKWELSQPNRFHIPLLFFGDVIKPEFRGRKFNRIGNQTDIVATLLHQLNLPSTRYHWSRDLFNPTTPQIAFYNSKDAFGVITPEQVVSFDNVGKIINFKQNSHYSTAKTDSLLNIGKAYYQEVYKEFLKY